VRDTLALVFLLLLAGCSSSSPKIQGWHIATELSNCKDCGPAQDVLDTYDPGVNVSANATVENGRELFGVYESGVPAGIPVSLTWVADHAMNLSGNVAGADRELSWTCAAGGAPGAPKVPGISLSIQPEATGCVVTIAHSIDLAPASLSWTFPGTGQTVAFTART
jgi:hypothetical protein